MNIHLPDYRECEFEDFLLRAIDFATGKPISSKIDNTDYYIQQGNEKYFFSFYKEALEFYALALKNDVRAIDAWVGQIRVLLDLGLYESALYWVRKSIKRCENNTLLECLNALCLTCTGNNREARKVINRPVKMTDSPMVWLIRGETLIKFKGHRFLFLKRNGIGPIGAFFSFLKAIEPDPGNGFINQRIGIAYLQEDYLIRAFEHLHQALISAPQNPLTLYYLAEYYNRRRNYPYARFYAKKALAFNPYLDAAVELLQFLHSPVVKFREKLGVVI